MEKVLFLPLSNFSPPKHNNSIIIVTEAFSERRLSERRPFTALQQNTRLGIL